MGRCCLGGQEMVEYIDDYCCLCTNLYFDVYWNVYLNVY